MAPKDSSDCVVTVTIELGHQAHFLREPSPEGFTHDWTIFVRGQEGSRLEAFVEKVVFRLHKTFKCPLRTISEPPYKVSESGYAGFLLPIEIHFKNKQSPRKIVFSYDLFLNAKDSPPINNVRIEKLKFQNPTPEFKAKLLKAGGIEQGADPVPYTYPDQLSALMKSDHKKSLKVPKDKEKKKKKSAPKSPDLSLSSLSSSSSSLSDGEPNLPPPPPPPRKEKDKSSHKKGSSSFTPLSKPESSSSQTDIDKHKSVSNKERYSLESDGSHKSHKSKSKDKNLEKLSSSHKSREDFKKDKEISHREGSHSSTKSSGEKKSSSNSSLHKDKERSSSKKEKESTSSLHPEKHNSSSKEKEKHSLSSHKSKHSSHKDVSLSSGEKKSKGEINEPKVSKDKSNSESKSHKRPQETQQDENSEKKKLKRSTSLASVEDRNKDKVDLGKDKHKSSHKESKEHDSKIKREKDQMSSSSKSKLDEGKNSDRHKHTHSSDSKQKEGMDKKSSRKHKESKLKTDNIQTMTKSDHLAMTADFQPKLLLSPLKDKSSDESNEPSPARVVEQKKSKRAKSTSSYSSLSSHELEKSDIDTQELQVDKVKNIISGLTDSDSDSGDDILNVTKSPAKEHKTVPSKPSQAASESKHLNSKSISHNSLEKRKISDAENILQENVKTSTRYDKNLKLDLSAKSETCKVKEQISKTKTVDKQSPDKTNTKDLDIFAPNGFPLIELISINEKIEKAHLESNRELLCRVVDIIGNTNDFDLDETSVFFDICSVDKSIVHQIQAALKEY